MIGMVGPWSVAAAVALMTNTRNLTLNVRPTRRGGRASPAPLGRVGRTRACAWPGPGRELGDVTQRVAVRRRVCGCHRLVIDGRHAFSHPSCAQQPMVRRSANPARRASGIGMRVETKGARPVHPSQTRRGGGRSDRAARDIHQAAGGSRSFTATRHRDHASGRMEQGQRFADTEWALKSLPQPMLSGYMETKGRTRCFGALVGKAITVRVGHPRWPPGDVPGDGVGACKSARAHASRRQRGRRACRAASRGHRAHGARGHRGSLLQVARAAAHLRGTRAACACWRRAARGREPLWREAIGRSSAAYRQLGSPRWECLFDRTATKQAATPASAPPGAGAARGMPACRQEDAARDHARGGRSAYVSRARCFAMPPRGALLWPGREPLRWRPSGGLARQRDRFLVWSASCRHRALVGRSRSSEKKKKTADEKAGGPKRYDEARAARRSNLGPGIFGSVPHEVSVMPSPPRARAAAERRRRCDWWARRSGPRATQAIRQLRIGGSPLFSCQTRAPQPCLEGGRIEDQRTPSVLSRP